ncbi:MAG: hypothetical protein ACJ749_20115 [Flavisolibacter sp.]
MRNWDYKTRSRKEDTELKMGVVFILGVALIMIFLILADHLVS